MESAAFAYEPSEIVYIAIVLLVILVVLIGLTIKFLLWVKILSKAGFSKWFALVLCVPFGTFIVMFILAFSDWPAIEKAKHVANTSDKPEISS